MMRIARLAVLLLAAGCGPVLREPAVRVADYSIYDLDSPWRDQGGAVRTLGTLRGRVQVMALVYTRCTHTCPSILAELKSIEAGLDPALRGRAGFVLVSLDPERDTPGRLAEFARGARLDPARWTLLSGDADGVRTLAALLRVRYRDEPDGQISHANSYFVLDREGRPAHRQDGLGTGAATVRATIHALAE